MKGIVTGIDRVSGIMNDIVASSREQASGIAQVNKAITQMDGATQQNAALVEESAAATLAMQEQSHKLKELVAVFQVEVAARAPAAAASARPALPAKKPAAPAPAPAKPAAARAARKAPPAKPAKPAAVAEDWEEF
jgi:methyl-accepting chemotaxis protein